MLRFVTGIVLGAVLMLLAQQVAAQTAGEEILLSGGDVLTVTCDGVKLHDKRISQIERELNCEGFPPTATPTPEPTATPVPPTPTPVPPTPTPTPVPPTPTPTPEPPTPTPQPGLTPSGPIVASAGQVISGLHVTSTTGDCITVPSGANNVTIRDSEIGPCGGNAIKASGVSGLNIWDNYIHTDHGNGGTCCDSGDGIFATNIVGLHIEGNYVARSEGNMFLLSVRDVVIRGNVSIDALGLFPRASLIQVWGTSGNRSSNVRVENNIAYSPFANETTTDLINFGQTDGVIAQNNYIEGGRYHSGCGLIVDASVSGADFLNNTLVDTGQCGIGVAGGQNITVDGNKVANDCIPPRCNVGIYVWDVYATGTCTGVTITNNTAYHTKEDGTWATYWNSGTCGPVTFSGNVFNQAGKDALTPKPARPPLVPIPHTNPAPIP